MVSQLVWQYAGPGSLVSKSVNGRKMFIDSEPTRAVLFISVYARGIPCYTVKSAQDLAQEWHNTCLKGRR